MTLDALSILSKTKQMVYPNICMKLQTCEIFDPIIVAQISVLSDV